MCAVLESCRPYASATAPGRGQQGNAVLAAGAAQESGRLVIEAENISKAYKERVLVRDFSLRIHRVDRIGLVGLNGAGKTALFSMLSGRLTPDQGSVRLGVNLEIAELDQKRVLDEEETLAH